MRFNQKVLNLRIPLSGSIDLTRRCNLHCVHCYIGDQNEVRADLDRELSTSEWLSVIDDLTRAGCLYLLMTGGDPILRKDFAEIYRHAKMNGLVITVFTNGTLITDKILDLFDEFPPRTVEISLYGSSAETYEQITGIKGSYSKCIDGIEKLLEKKIKVRLKTILMTTNHHEFSAIEAMADNYGVPFRFDPVLFPAFDGNMAPLDLRVPADEAAKLDFSNEERAKVWLDFSERSRDLPVSDALYVCGAGMNSFHVDAFGNLQPCLMVNSLKYNLKAGNFRQGWMVHMSQLQARKPREGYECNHCDYRSICGTCPALFDLENGAEDEKSEYLCSLGAQRQKEIQQKKTMEV